MRYQLDWFSYFVVNFEITRAERTFLYGFYSPEALFDWFELCDDNLDISYWYVFALKLHAIH